MARIQSESFLVDLDSGSCVDLSPGFVNLGGQIVCFYRSGASSNCMVTWVVTKRAEN